MPPLVDTHGDIDEKSCGVARLAVVIVSGETTLIDKILNVSATGTLLTLSTTRTPKLKKPV
jgi:hypothetical protein